MRDKTMADAAEVGTCAIVLSLAATRLGRRGGEAVCWVSSWSFGVSLVQIPARALGRMLIWAFSEN